jgi:hypothetical protein
LLQFRDLDETRCGGYGALGLAKRRTGTKVAVLIDDFDIRVCAATPANSSANLR